MEPAGNHKIAVLVGNGSYAKELVAAVSNQKPCIVVTLLPRKLSDFSSGVDMFGSIMNLDSIIAFLKKKGTTIAVFGGNLGPYKSVGVIAAEMLLGGNVFHAANIAYLRKHWNAIGIMSILRFVEERFLASGIRLNRATEHAPALKIQCGWLNPPRQRVVLEESGIFSLADMALRALSFQPATRIRQAVAFDSKDGQGCIIGIEHEGTDELLTRISRITKPAGAVRSILKLCPPQISPILDAPVIGPETIRRCGDAHVDLLAVDCNAGIVCDRQSVMTLAQEKSVCIFGLNVSRLSGIAAA